MTATTTWRGVTLDTRTAAQCAELAAIIGDDITVSPTQGSYRPRTRYSAGTHCGGGAVDISVRPLTAAQERRLVIAADRVGLCGWIRPAIPDLWVRHFHALSIPPNLKGPGVLDPSAWDQITACRRGRDGLASNGPDPHRSLRTWTTWETYQQGDLTMADITDLTNRIKAGFKQVHHDIGVVQTAVFKLATVKHPTTGQSWKLDRAIWSIWTYTLRNTADIRALKTKLGVK